MAEVITAADEKTCDISAFIVTSMQQIGGGISSDRGHTTRCGYATQALLLLTQHTLPRKIYAALTFDIKLSTRKIIIRAYSITAESLKSGHASKSTAAGAAANGTNTARGQPLSAVIWSCGFPCSTKRMNQKKQLNCSFQGKTQTPSNLRQHGRTRPL